MKCEVRLEMWDPADGKGIDDLLAAGKQPAVVTGQEVLARIDEIGRSAAGHPGDDADDAWFPKDDEQGVAPAPIEYLPEPLQRFVTTAARSLQCPADYLFMVILVVSSAAIGNSRGLRIRPGYVEIARIFGGIVAEAGSGKTPALLLGCRPAYEQQERADGPLSRGAPAIRRRQGGLRASAPDRHEVQGSLAGRSGAPGEAGIATHVCRERHGRGAGPRPGAVAPRCAHDPRRARSRWC